MVGSGFPAVTSKCEPDEGLRFWGCRFGKLSSRIGLVECLKYGLGFRLRTATGRMSLQDLGVSVEGCGLGV